MQPIVQLSRHHTPSTCMRGRCGRRRLVEGRSRYLSGSRALLSFPYILVVWTSSLPTSATALLASPPSALHFCTTSNSVEFAPGRAPIAPMPKGFIAHSAVTGEPCQPRDPRTWGAVRARGISICDTALPSSGTACGLGSLSWVLRPEEEHTRAT